MCGRYVAKIQAAELAEWHLIRNVPPFESYNVAPTQSVPIVRHTSEGNAADMVRWGLIPFFAKGIPPTYSTINATVEKIKDGASWPGPWKRGQRCAVLASGFYEWQALPGRAKRPTGEAGHHGSRRRASRKTCPRSGVWRCRSRPRAVGTWCSPLRRRQGF